MRGMVFTFRHLVVIIISLVIIGSSLATSERQHWIDTDTNFSGDDGDGRFREYYDEFDSESLGNLTQETFGDIELGEWENSYSTTTGIGWTTSTDSSDKIEGTNSDKLTMVSGDDQGSWLLLNLHIDGEETMRVTFWIKCNTTGVRFRENIYWQDWDSVRENYNGFDLKAVPTTWTKYTLTPSNFSNWGGANNEDDQRFFSMQFQSVPAKDAHIHFDGLHLEWVNASLNGGSSVTTYPDGHNTTENPTSKAYRVSNGENESYTFITKDINTFSYRPTWIELYLNITSFDYDLFRKTEYVMIGSGLQNTTESQTNFTGLMCIYNNATHFQAQVYLNGTWKSNIGNYSYNEWVHVVVGSVMLDGYNDRLSIIIDDDRGYLEEETDVNQTTTHGVGVLFHLDFNTSSVLVDDLYLNNHHDDTYNVDQTKISYYGKAPYPSDSGVLGGDGYKNFLLSDNYNQHIWRNHYVSVVSRNDDVYVITFNTSWNQTTVVYQIFDMDTLTSGDPVILFDGDPIPGFAYTTFNTMDAEIFNEDLFLVTAASTGTGDFGASLIRYNFTTTTHSIALLDPTMGAPSGTDRTTVPRIEVVDDRLFISWTFINAVSDLMRWAIYDGSTWSYFNDTEGPTDGGGSYGCELVYINTILYCLWTSNSGGYAYNARYDFTYNNWTDLGKLEEIGRHVYPAATVYKGRVWLATMWNGRWNPIHGTEYYDIGIFQMLENGTYVGPPSYLYNVLRYFASPAIVVYDDYLVVVYNNYMAQSRTQQMGPSISLISQSPGFLASIDASTQLSLRSYSFEGSFSGVDQNVTFLWNFDDGSISDEQDPEHEFPGPGTYDVTLTVIDEYGATSNTIRTISVSAGGGGGAGNLHVSFTYQDTTWGIKFTPVHPTTYQVDSYKWLFGDGSSSTRRCPTHWYRNPGEYIVTIEIRFSNGIISAKTQSITVNEFSDLQFLFHLIERDEDRVYLRFGYYEVVFTELSLVLSGMLAFVAVSVSLHDRKKYKRFKESTATIVLRMIAIIWVGIAILLLIWIRMGGI